METSGPTSGIPRPAASSPAGAVQWRVGQILHATVTDVGVGKALLAIGNRQVSAETSLTLRSGEHLTLEVRRLGATPLLRLVAATPEPALAAAIRQLLPRQGALPPLLANLERLALAPNPPLPPLLSQLVRAMVRQIPDVPTVSTAAGVRQAIARSGAFLERHIHSALADSRPVNLDGDFKANLLRLVQLVRNWPGSPASPPPAAARLVTGPATTPAPAAGAGAPSATGSVQSAQSAPPVLPPPLPGAAPVPQAAAKASLDLMNHLGNLRADLLQQSEAALARVQLHQLAALPREGERGLLEWLLELPVRHGNGVDLWSMRITRDPRQQQQDGAGEPAWSVQLAFDLPGLGPLRARVLLSGERISTHFWAEQVETLPLLNEHLPELRRALTDAGLEVGDLDCQAGAPVAEQTRSGPPLIREKA